MFYANSTGDRFLLPGRVRIGVKGLKGNWQYAYNIDRYIARVDGVKKVHANYYTGNVLIYFDNTYISIDKLEDFLLKAVPRFKALPESINNQVLSREKDKIREKNTGKAPTAYKVLPALTAFSCLVFGRYKLGLLAISLPYARKIIYKFLYNKYTRNALDEEDSSSTERKLVISNSKIDGIQLNQPELSKNDTVQAYFKKIAPITALAALASLALTGNILSLLALLIILSRPPVGFAPNSAFWWASRNAYRSRIILNPITMEALGRIDRFVFNKTGTLTAGNPEIISIIPTGRNTGDKLVILAASFEESKYFPLISSLKKEALSRKLDTKDSQNNIAYPGKGVSCIIDKKEVVMGSKLLMIEKNITTKNHITKERRIKHLNQSPVYVSYGNKILGLIGVRDVLRQESLSCIEQLRIYGIGKIDLITDDTQEIAENIAQELGIENFCGGLSYEHVSKKIEQAKDTGDIVAYVGNGLGDDAALGSADIDIIFSQDYSNNALEKKQIIIANNNLMSLPSIIDLSKYSIECKHQNDVLSMGLSTIAIILVLSNSITPIYALAFKELINIMVLVNSIRPGKYNMKYLDKQVK